MMEENSENIFNEELDKLLLVKIQLWENFSERVQHKRQNSERRNTEHALTESQHKRNLKDDQYWQIFIGQIKFNVFSHAGNGIMNTFV